MKRINLLVVFALFNIHFLIGQVNGFKQFLSYFPDVSLPYAKDNFSVNKQENIPSSLAYNFLCKGDSSLLTFESIGVNQETQDVVYRNLKPFQYRAFAKAKVEEFYLLIYDGYVSDGYHEYTTVLNVGLFSNKGELLDEIPFYIFDDTGRLKEQTGELTTDYKILLKKIKYEPNRNGQNGKSYKKVTEIFEIEKGKDRFIKTGEKYNSEEDNK